jgi:hypothetical protein
MSECEFSGESDTDVDMLQNSDQRANSDDEGSANDNSDMKNDAWTRVGAERSHFLFSRKPGMNVDLEDQNKPQEYFELFITP